MTDTTNTADDSNTPDEQTDEDLDDSIRDAGGTTSFPITD